MSAPHSPSRRYYWSVSKAARSPNNPDDELLAAELARLDRKIDSAGAEKRRLGQALPSRTGRNARAAVPLPRITLRHTELIGKRDTLAAERTALARGNLLRRRVTDWRQGRGVIDQLDRAQRQQLMRVLIEAVHVGGSHIQIQPCIPFDPPEPPAGGARQTRPKPTSSPSGVKPRPFTFRWC